MSLFSDVNVNVHGKRDILKVMPPLNELLLEKLKCNYFNILLSIAIFYLLFIHLSFIKLHQLTLSR